MSPVPARTRLTSGGRSIRPTEKKPGADLARTDSATFTGAAFSSEDSTVLDAQLAITSIGAGATITPKLQQSLDGSTDWQDVPNGAFPGQTATTTGVNRTFVTPGAFLRWVVTIAQGSTPAPISYSIDTQSVITI